MKLNFGKRVVLFFHWLFSLILAACVFGSAYVAKLYEKIAPMVDARYIRIAAIAFLAVYAILAIAVLVMTFKRSGARSERGFITMDSSDSGRVRIAVGAIEQMVKQAVGTVDGIADMRISIESMEDAIAINVNVSVVNGSHVPTVTMNMQRAIRQFVEMNCGVAVRSVSINVQTVVNPAENAKRGRKAEAKAVPAAQPVVAPESEIVPVEMPVVYVPVEEPVVQTYAEPVAAPVEEPVVAVQEEYADPVAESVFEQEMPAEEYVQEDETVVAEESAEAAVSYEEEISVEEQEDKI